MQSDTVIFKRIDSQQLEKPGGQGKMAATWIGLPHHVREKGEPGCWTLQAPDGRPLCIPILGKKKVKIRFENKSE